MILYITNSKGGAKRLELKRQTKMSRVEKNYNPIKDWIKFSLWLIGSIISFLELAERILGIFH